MSGLMSCVVCSKAYTADVRPWCSLWCEAVAAREPVAPLVAVPARSRQARVPARGQRQISVALAEALGAARAEKAGRTAVLTQALADAKRVLEEQAASPALADAKRALEEQAVIIGAARVASDRLQAELRRAQADARRLLGELYIADEVNLLQDQLDLCGVEDQRAALVALGDTLDRYDLPGLGVVVRRVLATGVAAAPSAPQASAVANAAPLEARAEAADAGAAAYISFAGQVSSVLAEPDEGGIAPDALGPSDFPILLDHLQDRLHRAQVYGDFAVAVWDLMLAPEDEELRGLLVLACLPELLGDLRERLAGHGAALAAVRAEGEAAGLARGRAEATASLRLAAAATESQVERCALSRAADTVESWTPTAPAEDT